MTKTSLLLCTSVAALSLATGASAQSERMAPGAGGGAPAAKEMAPPSGAEMPASRAEPGAAGGEMERGASSPERAYRSDNPEEQGRRSKGERAADTEKSQKSDREGSASTGASEGTAGTDDKPSGSVTQLSGEKRTKAKSAFRLHRSQAVVKDIDISVSVGVAVPRSVSLYAVPRDVVNIVPEYRRYKYFIYDDKVVVVDPDTYEIVDVLILA